MLERQWEIMVWSSARKKIYLHINLSRCISLYFLSASVALNILSVYQLFHDFENFMSLFGHFQFLAPICLEVIYSRCNPDTIINNWNMRNISTRSWCLFCMVFFPTLPYIYITWKPPHVQCKHKMNFGFVVITYIPFPFFSLLYNSSSFYQCLHFVWHLVMYKLLTKILLSPSFCLKCSMPY